MKRALRRLSILRSLLLGLVAVCCSAAAAGTCCEKPKVQTPCQMPCCVVGTIVEQSSNGSSCCECRDTQDRSTPTAPLPSAPSSRILAASDAPLPSSVATKPVVAQVDCPEAQREMQAAHISGPRIHLIHSILRL